VSRGGRGTRSISLSLEMLSSNLKATIGIRTNSFRIVSARSFICGLHWRRCGWRGWRYRQRRHLRGSDSDCRAWRRFVLWLLTQEPKKIAWTWIGSPFSGIVACSWWYSRSTRRKIYAIVLSDFWRIFRQWLL